MNLPSHLQNLNKPQHTAVLHQDGPLLVLAGAGSGKTRVLTCRIVQLIHQQVSPTQILAVTFTNKAAKEMGARVDRLLDESGLVVSGKPTMGTFHSICVRILRQHVEAMSAGLFRNFVIFDSDESLSLIKIILKEKGISDKEFKPKAIQINISSAKNQLIDPVKYWEEFSNENEFTNIVSKVFTDYQKRLMEHNALDFDDLLQKTVECFERCPEVLAYFRKKWQYVLVDEYQDTNFAQYRFIRLLTDEHQNLCVVGDDHQSIYSFRGADFRNILDFERDYSDATVVKLEQNYRSTGNILKNANKLIGFNQTGRPKNLWTDGSDGEKIEIVEVWNEKSEGEKLVEKVRAWESLGLGFDDMAVLYRMNAQSRSLEEALMKARIPYQIVGGVRFFDRLEIRDIIAYLRLIFNPRDDLAFIRVVNVPGRKIGAASIEVVKEYARNYSLSLLEILAEVANITELNQTKRNTLGQFHHLIQKLREDNATLSLTELIEQIVERTNYFVYLDDGTSEGEARIQNVKELFSVALRYETAEEPLAAFLEGVALISDLDQMNVNEPSLTLMTVHAAKGLEFPAVFLPGWEEGIFPSNSSQYDPHQLEEERRLAYVAITRAEKYATISYAQQRMLFGQTQYASASKFTKELDEGAIVWNKSSEMSEFGRVRTQAPSFSHPLVDPSKTTESSRRAAIFGEASSESVYKVGDTVKHADWGEGTVLRIAGDVMSASFKGQGMKTLVISIAPIEKA